MSTKTRAVQLLENPLLDKLFSEYEQKMFREFTGSNETAVAERLWLKCRAHRELRTFIRNRLEALANGQ